MTPTPQQTAIIEAVTGSTRPIMVIANAGTGKTTLLTMIAEAMPATTSLLGLAFNVRIKKELEKRFPEWAVIKTVNGLGHSAFGKAIGKRLILDEKKIGRLVTTVCRESGFAADSDQWSAIRWAVGQAMLAGLIPSKYSNFKGLVPDDEASWAVIGEPMAMSRPLLDLARAALTRSIAESFAGTICFDDQIYMSALFNGVFPRFANVLVEEAQDLSPLNHIMLRKTVGPDGRLIVVGDPCQSLYAFRGADFESMSKIKAMRPEWIELPLSVTFRCPRTIVARQWSHVPDYRAHETNAEGSFAVAPNPWSLDKLGLSGSPVTMLCRNNAPLVGLAFKLIRDRIGCSMIGRDIGKGLKALAKKLVKPEDGPETMAASIKDWRDTQCALAQAKDDEAKLDKVTDQADSLMAILDGSGAKSGQSLFEEIEILFSKEGTQVTLSTGHRAKGLEWETVIHLDPWRIPSKWAAKTPSALRQELNLRYVIETRAKRALIEANAEEYANV